MTLSMVGRVRDGLHDMVTKIRDARARCERGGAIDRDIGQMKSAMAGVQSRYRDQKGRAAALLAGSRADRHQLVARLSMAEERAADFVQQLDYLRDLLAEVQSAAYLAEKAAKDTATPL